MNSPDTELINEIKNDIAKQYGNYQTFSELLQANCKTNLIAAAVNGLIDYVAFEFQRQDDRKRQFSKDRNEQELLNAMKKQYENI